MLVFEALHFALVTFVDTHDFRTVFVFRLELSTARLSAHRLFEGSQNVCGGKLYRSSRRPLQPWVEAGEWLYRLDQSLAVVEREPLATLAGSPR